MATIETLKEHGFAFLEVKDEREGFVEIDKSKMEETLSEEGKKKLKDFYATMDIPTLSMGGKRSTHVEIMDDGKRYKINVHFTPDGELGVDNFFCSHKYRVEAYRKGDTVLWAVTDDGQLRYLRLPKASMFSMDVYPETAWDEILKEFDKQARRYDKRMSDRFLKKVEKLKARYASKEKILNDAYADLSKESEEEKK